MKYTTLQKDGQLRTIDTDHDSTLSLVTEFILDWPFAKKRKKAIAKAKNKVATKVERVPMKVNYWVHFWLFMFFLLCVFLGVVSQGW